MSRLRFMIHDYVRVINFLLLSIIIHRSYSALCMYHDLYFGDADSGHSPPGHFPPVTSATTYYLNVENVSNYIDLGPLSGLGVGVGMGRNRVSKFFSHLSSRSRGKCQREGDQHP